MKVAHYTDIEPVIMNNDMVKNVAGRVLIGKADGAQNFCMRLFQLDKDGYSPRHTHDWEHEIFVHEGQGQVFLEGEWQDITAGTAIFIPPNADHQIRNVGDNTLSFICLVPPSSPEM